MRLMQWWNAWSPVKLTVGLRVLPFRSRGKEEVDAGALLVGCGVDGHRSAVRLIRIGLKGLRFEVSLK